MIACKYYREPINLCGHGSYLTVNHICPLTAYDSMYYRGLREGKELACRLIEIILRDGK